MRIDKTLDIKGLTNQRPSEVTTKILGIMRAGQVLRVIVDDAGARKNIPLLCEDLGCKVLSVEEDGRTIFFTIQK